MGGSAEGNVFGLSSTQGCLGLKLAAPLDGAAIVCIDISSAGQDAISKVRKIFVPCFGKVSANVHVKSTTVVVGVYHAFVTGSSKIMVKMLDCLFMKIGRAVGQVQLQMAIGHTDVWACFSGDPTIKGYFQSSKKSMRVGVENMDGQCGSCLR